MNHLYLDKVITNKSDNTYHIKSKLKINIKNK